MIVAKRNTPRLWKAQEAPTVTAWKRPGLVHVNGKDNIGVTRLSQKMVTNMGKVE